MEGVHKTLLAVNEEFLVSEAPAGPLLLALRQKDILTPTDVEQIRCLEAQGPRAVKRFVLNVLPKRGPLAFPAFLEALQEARAQHLVDLLLEEERVLCAACKPIELPKREPPKPLPDPNEYAKKLQANKELIQEVVDPSHVTPTLVQNGVLSALEQQLLSQVSGQHELTWTVLWSVLMQRGQKAFSAFMAALLQHGYSALFHTIEETRVGKAAPVFIRPYGAESPRSRTSHDVRNSSKLGRSEDNNDLSDLPAVKPDFLNDDTPRLSSRENREESRYLGLDEGPERSSEHDNTREREDDKPDLGKLDTIHERGGSELGESGVTSPANQDRDKSPTIRGQGQGPQHDEQDTKLQGGRPDSARAATDTQSQGQDEGKRADDADNTRSSSRKGSVSPGNSPQNNPGLFSFPLAAGLQFAPGETTSNGPQQDDTNNDRNGDKPVQTTPKRRGSVSDR